MRSCSLGLLPRPMADWLTVVLHKAQRGLLRVQTHAKESLHHCHQVGCLGLGLGRMVSKAHPFFCA